MGRDRPGRVTECDVHGLERQRHTPQPRLTTHGATTPEELETLFEDALVLRDAPALCALFQDGAVLAVGDGNTGCDLHEIAQRALATWEDEHVYVADPRCVMQARDIALVVSDHGVNVAQRGHDGAWRFAIVHLFVEDGKASNAT